MIPLLEPIFQGAWAALGEALHHSPEAPVGSVRVIELLAPARLDAALQRHARHLGVTGRDLRASASSWSLGYLSTLLSPVAAAASVLQHRFPVGAEQMAVELDEAGMALRFHISTAGVPAPGSSTAQRYDTLLWRHLAPLFAAISRQTKLPPKVLWGNAARQLGSVLDQALRLVGNAEHLVKDRDTLLDQPIWPDGRINPMHARQPVAIALNAYHAPPADLHRQCCLCYLLPGQDYCQACPLVPRRARAAPVSSAWPR